MCKLKKALEKIAKTPFSVYSENGAMLHDIAVKALAEDEQDASKFEMIEAVSLGIAGNWFDEEVIEDDMIDPQSNVYVSKSPLYRKVITETKG